jgi:integrase
VFALFPCRVGQVEVRGEDAALPLAGGDAGLRLGEIVALEWRDIDLAARRLTVERSDSLGHVTVPKGGRSRQHPLTKRLTEAPKAARHLQCERGPRKASKSLETLWTRDRRPLKACETRG